MGPGNGVVPCIWRYRDLRPELLRAAELVTTDEAERRVLLEAGVRYAQGYLFGQPAIDETFFARSPRALRSAA